MFKKRSIILSVVAVIVLGVGVAFAAGLLNLPMIPVYVTHSAWLGGTYSTLDITLSGVPDGYDVSNRTYIGWCIEDNWAPDPEDDSLLMLMDSTDPSSFVIPCENYADIPWDRVNYLLNHTSGVPWDIQVALWVVAETDYKQRTLGAQAIAMIADTAANGAGFVPGPGQIVAVALCADGLSGEVDPRGIQDTMIEVLVPPGDEGCTPGYWKQDHHFDSWVPTGYAPDDDFGDVFGVEDSWNDDLLEALWKKGGKEKALLRHATAALLNAANGRPDNGAPDLGALVAGLLFADGFEYGDDREWSAAPEVHSYYTVDEVISMVQSAYADETFNDIKDLFEAANEMGCPLH